MTPAAPAGQTARRPTYRHGDLRRALLDAGIALVRAAKAQALISGRDYVAPDDVQAIIAQTIAHRLVPVGDAGRGAVEQVQAMVQSVALP